MRNHPLDALAVHTPTLSLRMVTDELLDELADAVRAGKADAWPDPYDDPISLHEPDPQVRVTRWLQAIWRARGSLTAGRWRLDLAVVVDDRPVGIQALTATDFASLGQVTTFSWLSADVRGRGLGREMRQAVLHLAFDGLGAREATSDAFADNLASNAVSRSLGYSPNGFDWATRRGELAELQRWRLARPDWVARRREDITIRGLDALLAALHPGSAAS